MAKNLFGGILEGAGNVAGGVLKGAGDVLGGIANQFPAIRSLNIREEQNRLQGLIQESKKQEQDQALEEKKVQQIATLAGQIDPNDPNAAQQRQLLTQELLTIPRFRKLQSKAFQSGFLGQAGPPSPQEEGDLFSNLLPRQPDLPITRTTSPTLAGGTVTRGGTTGASLPTKTQVQGSIFQRLDDKLQSGGTLTDIEQRQYEAFSDLASASAAQPPQVLGKDNPFDLPEGTVTQFDANGKMSIIIEGPKGEELPPEKKAETALNLRDKFTSLPTVKNMDRVVTSLGIMEAGARVALDPNTKSFLGSDQALNVTYQKILDPESVVRTSEYLRTPENVSLLNKAIGKYEQITKGGVAMTTEDRIELFKMGQKIVEEWKKTFNKQYDIYATIADNDNLKLDKEILFGGMKKFEIDESKLAFDPDQAFKDFEVRESGAAESGALQEFNQGVSKEEAGLIEQLKANQEQLDQLDSIPKTSVPDDTKLPAQPPAKLQSLQPTNNQAVVQQFTQTQDIAKIVKGNPKAQRQVAEWKQKKGLTDAEILSLLNDETVRLMLGVK